MNRSARLVKVVQIKLESNNSLNNKTKNQRVSTGYRLLLIVEV